MMLLESIKHNEGIQTLDWQKGKQNSKVIGLDINVMQKVVPMHIKYDGEMAYNLVVYIFISPGF